MNPPANRFRSALPKIGIRPTIDGRRQGVRESLEDVTMNMAKAAAALISGSLRHPNGQSVECVVADTTIGGVAEAAACADKFSRENVAVTLTVTPCWCYGSETMDMDPLTVKAVWGFNGTDRPGAVYLAAVLAAHSQKGLPAFGIYGRDVQDLSDTDQIPADVAEKILRFARAGLAAAWMKGKSYLSVGSVSMGIAGSIVDADFFQAYLGMRNEYVDMSELVRRFEEKIYSDAEFKHALEWVKGNCTEGPDVNDPQIQHSWDRKDKAWATSVKMAMLVRDLMVGNPDLKRKRLAEEALGHNAILAGFQGQRAWADHFPNGDFIKTILNSSFDWNGIRAPYVVDTKNDARNGVSMLFGYLLTGTSQIFSDVRTYWSPEAARMDARAA
jgi:L-fucose isomerase